MNFNELKYFKSWSKSSIFFHVTRTQNVLSYGRCLVRKQWFGKVKLLIFWFQRLISYIYFYGAKRKLRIFNSSSSRRMNWWIKIDIKPRPKHLYFVHKSWDWFYYSIYRLYNIGVAGKKRIFVKQIQLMQKKEHKQKRNKMNRFGKNLSSSVAFKRIEQW